MEHFPLNVFFLGKHPCSGCEAVGLGSTLQNNTSENQLSAPSWCLLDNEAAGPVCWYYCSGYVVQTQILKRINKEGVTQGKIKKQKPNPKKQTQKTDHKTPQLIMGQSKRRLKKKAGK